MSLVTEQWTAPDKGALFVVTGASGTGKTTLVTEALARIPGLRFSVSATTRPARPGEVDGEDYHFLSRDEFESKVAEGAFLEWAEVYGNCYGTLKSQVQAALDVGESILLDIDTQGAALVRPLMPEAISIFILPPLPKPFWRRASSWFMSSGVSRSPAGIPSSIAVTAGPWDSPAVSNLII